MSLAEKPFSFVLSVALIVAGSQAYAGVVLDTNFEAATGATAGPLSGAGSFGTPPAGTLSATGGFITGTRPAYTTGNNGNTNNVLPNNNGTFNDLGTPGGAGNNVLTATLASPAAVAGGLGAGQTTTVDFDLASWGTNNLTSFKYTHVIGLSSSGQEVFQILWRAGSNSGFREVYARELGEDNTTFANSAYVSNDGTKILDDVAFGISGTSTTVTPSGRVSVSLVFDEFGWNASAAPTGGGSTQTPVTGLGIASGATDLASIQFFSSQNQNNGGQNNGFHIDNLLVETDVKVIPEPSSAVAILALAVVGGLRRRR